MIAIGIIHPRVQVVHLPHGTARSRSPRRDLESKEIAQLIFAREQVIPTGVRGRGAKRQSTGRGAESPWVWYLQVVDVGWKWLRLVDHLQVPWYLHVIEGWFPTIFSWTMVLVLQDGFVSGELIIDGCRMPPRCWTCKRREHMHTYENATRWQDH